MRRRPIVATLLGVVGAGLAVLLPAPAAQSEDPVLSEARPLKVVLVGDSFAAGNGARDADNSTDFYGPEDCLRSSSNWAEKYVDRLQDDGYNVTFINRACSGATFDDLTVDRGMSGRTGTYVFDGLGVGDLEEARARATEDDVCNDAVYDDQSYTYEVSGPVGPGPSWLVTCERELLPQLDAVNADTDIVLMTMGGNDAGFRDVIVNCFVSPGAGACRNAVADAREEVPNIRGELVGAIEAMRARGLREDARLVVGAYPLLALDNHYEIVNASPTTVDRFAVADEVRQLGREGDAAIREAVATANIDHPGQVVHLDTVHTAFAGHEPDASNKAQNPDRWLFEVNEGEPFGLFGDFDAREIYHPNPIGHTEYAELLAANGTFGAHVTPENGGDIDIAFVLDATGSMAYDIDQMRTYMSTVIDQVEEAGGSARYSLSSYRDHSEHTGDPSDYPGRLEQGFTYDGQLVKEAMGDVVASGGGDYPESLYSGVMAALEQQWRPGVKKVVIVLADAPPHEPEPVTGLHWYDVYEKAFSLDPAEVYLIDTYGAGDDNMMQLVQKSGGVRIDAWSTDVPTAVTSILTTALEKPYAWINGPYVARTGSSLELDGSGSYATNGEGLTYEWDFDQDGVFDLTSAGAVVTHRFDEPFSGVLTLRVTDSEGRWSLATTHVGITEDGDEIPRDRDNCPEVDNFGQGDSDGDGVGDACDPTPYPPAEDQQWPFDGFDAPVANLPDGNTVNAGRSIPIKFGLGADRGTDVLAAGSPSSRRIACDTGAEFETLTETTTSTPGLLHEAGTADYTYVWSTRKTWAGTCRMFTLQLTDGSTHEASFRFR